MQSQGFCQQLREYTFFSPSDQWLPGKGSVQGLKLAKVTASRQLATVAIYVSISWPVTLIMSFIYNFTLYSSTYGEN